MFISAPFRFLDSVGETTSQPAAKKHKDFLTDSQLSVLESVFQKQRYFSREKKILLAESLHLPETQIDTWYIERRKIYETTLL